MPKASLHLRDVDELLVKKLHQRAKANGRSAAEEHRQILRQVLLSGAGDDWFAWARAFREQGAGQSKAHPQLPPAEVLIREGRDER